MRFKPLLSIMLIATQASLPFAMAEDTAAPSAEFTLLENVLALEGQQLSRSQVQIDLSKILSQYEGGASSSGASDRMQQALIQLGVFTPAQAKRFVQDSQNAANKVVSPDSENGPQVATAEVAELAQMYPMGAQFSGCKSTAVGVAEGVAAGTMVGSFGAFVLGWAMQPGDAAEAANAPYEATGKQMMLYSGIAFGVAAIAEIVLATTCH